MIDAEGEGIPAVLTSDPKDEDGVAIFLAPKWNPAGITLAHSSENSSFPF